MPICYRCGKSLCSEQALTYHLNRKYKCGSWKCVGCNLSFTTKFDMNIHLLRCECQHKHQDTPSSDILMDVFKHIPISLFIVDDKNTICSYTPFTTSQIPHVTNIVGKPIDNIQNTEKITSQIYLLKTH